MPNWCYNTLLIEAEPQVIAKIKAQLSAPYESKHQDFPSEEWITETVQKDLSFWNITRPPDDKTGEYHGTHGYANGEKQGDTEWNWYNWNIHNWGVKWDASEPELAEESEISLQYRFNTPWGVAEGAMLSLSQQYPDVGFNLEFEEETGWGGEVEFTNGVSEVIQEYTSRCRQCSALDTLESCKKCDNYLCSKCNYGEFIDEDTLKECEIHKHLANEEVKA